MPRKEVGNVFSTILKISKIFQIYIFNSLLSSKYIVFLQTNKTKLHMIIVIVCKRKQTKVKNRPDQGTKLRML